MGLSQFKFWQMLQGKVRCDHFYIQIVRTIIHILVTFDLSLSKKIYINGTLDAESTSNTSQIPVNSSNFFIGAHQPTNVPNWSINGKIDDIGVWNRALSQSEVFVSQVISSTSNLMKTQSLHKTMSFRSQLYFPILFLLHQPLR